MTDLETEAEQLREIQRLNAHINKLDAEIERLHAENERLTDKVRNRDRLREIMHGEIERLRAIVNEQAAAIVQLDAELRAALENKS